MTLFDLLICVYVLSFAYAGLATSVLTATFDFEYPKAAIWFVRLCPVINTLIMIVSLVVVIGIMFRELYKFLRKVFCEEHDWKNGTKEFLGAIWMYTFGWLFKISLENKI